MTPVEILAALVAGNRPTNGLLHTVRLEAFGVETYGKEAIVECFRNNPFDLSDDATVIECGNHIAVCEEDTVLFADLSGGNVSRIWRLGDGDLAEGEPSISVAFDPDLTQERGDVFLDGSDHPDLSGDAVETAIATGQLILSSIKAYRSRAFAVRAFGNRKRLAVLFAIYRLDGDNIRTSGFSMAAAIYDGQLKAVNDVVGQAAVESRVWCPRIA